MNLFRVYRNVKRLPSSEVIKNHGVAIVPYECGDRSWLRTVSMQPICQLQQPLVPTQWSYLNLLWHIGWFSASDVRPNWSGFMQSVCHGEHSSGAVVSFLPVVDMNPSDETCLYSTLLYVMDQSQQLGIVTPCITFDMPLWRKAVEIANSANLDIVCKLGGFHTVMSFLRSVGHLMSESGLEDLFRLNYGPETVSHIMTGKAVSRAIRAHFLVESGHMINLLTTVLADFMTELDVNEVSRIHNLFHKVLQDGLCVTFVQFVIMTRHCNTLSPLCNSPFITCLVNPEQPSFGSNTSGTLTY